MGAFTALSPRQPITPAPYSIFAVRTLWTNILGIPPGFLDGVDDPGADWSRTGNAGTTAGTNFIGTTDNQPLEFRVNDTRAMRYEPNPFSPNVIGGFNGNSVTSGAFGAAIGGGGNSSDGSNRVTDSFGIVGGGANNQAGDNIGTTDVAQYATVGGGFSNTASRVSATVAGGSSNIASGDGATVGGGSANTASGEVATVGGGLLNTASGENATVGGGISNIATGTGATVGGGVDNDVSGFAATIPGGSDNIASEQFATIGGGLSNVANARLTTIGGGQDNIASGVAATVGGGVDNDVSGFAATIPGGSDNTASGDYSFAAGRNANANDLGAFAWADATGAQFSSLGDNTFNVRASGGTFFISNSVGNTGVFLAPGGGSWASLSDEALKENVEAIDPTAVLDALVSIPVSTWNYISQDDAIRHMGVMAQDFYAAFGIGEDERHITTIDADGVAFAAIQGLNHKLEAENVALRSRIDTLEHSNIALEARLAQLEALAAGGQSASLLPFALFGGLGLLAILARRR